MFFGHVLCVVGNYPEGYAALAITGHFASGQIVSYGFGFLAECHCQRQSHITQPDNGDNFPIHSIAPPGYFLCAPTISRNSLKSLSIVDIW